jgi:hypothetical protein
MSTLTKAERDALPASSYGSPSTRTFPITCAADVMAAATLLGKAPPQLQAHIRARITAIAKKNNWPLPQAWK